MEYQYPIHRKLLELFTKPYLPEDTLKHEEFSKEIRQIFHDFMEECRNNVNREDATENIMFFSDIHTKYKNIKKHLFQIPDSNVFVYLPTGMSYSTKSNYNYIKILSTLLIYLDDVIDYLDKLVKKYSVQLSDSNSKNKPEYPSFFAKIDDDEYLRDAYDQLIGFKLISKETLFDSFIRVFRGKLPTEKIRWKGKPGLLRYFIRSINGKGIEPIKSYWKTTVECFKNDETDSDFNISQLQFGHDPKKTRDIDLVIQTFNENIDE